MADVLVRLKTPDQLEAEITIRATVKELREYAEAIKKSGEAAYFEPLGSLLTALNKSIRAAEEGFNTSTDGSPC
jgi:hypothetical protein